MKFNIQKQIQNLCQPAYIYLILTCVTTLMYVYMIMNKSFNIGLKSIAEAFEKRAIYLFKKE